MNEARNDTSGTVQLPNTASYVTGSAMVTVIPGGPTTFMTLPESHEPVIIGNVATWTFYGVASGDTYNIDFSNTALIGESHVVTYGATARQNDFVLSIAPQGSDREEYGIFLQDEILIGDRVRWLIGARWDDIDPVGSVVSPQVTWYVSPLQELSLARRSMKFSAVSA